MHESFSSLPPEEEQQFVVFEQRTQAAQKSANVLGWGFAIALLVVTLMVVIGFWGPIEQPGAPDPAAPAPAAPK